MRRLSDLEEQRKKKADGEEKLPEKNRVHSFILDLELGTEERQRTAGKTVRKEKERKDKEKEKERPDERLKHKLRKTGDGDEKDGGTARGAADEKKGSKVKPDRKSSVSSREVKTIVTEAADEENLKKGKSEKEKAKVSGKSLRRLDSTGSSEERSEVEAGSEVSRKKDKHPKEALKRSKSHPEGKPGEKLKVRSERKDSSTDKNHSQKSISENESDVRKVEAGSKVRSLSEKHRSKSQSSAGKSDKKPEAKAKTGKEERKTAEEKAKLAKKTTEKKLPKDPERISGAKEDSSAGDPESVSSTTVLPNDPYGALSDVTPESEDEGVSAAEPRPLSAEPRPLSAEADALLSLMDVCSSASERRETEADLKMKEAALTLLSMDPDLARSSSLVSQSPVDGKTLPTGAGRESCYAVDESQDAGTVSITIIDCC